MGYTEYGSSDTQEPIGPVLGDFEAR